MTLQARHR